MAAHSAIKQGKSCLIIEKENHIGGYCYTEKINGIDIHVYGAHIFRTNSKKVWEFVNSICEFLPFINSPLANYHGQIFNLPFNMNTFHQMWGCVTPQEAVEKINETSIPCTNPTNLEEYIISQIGTELYNVLVKGYTEKQWGKKCSELPKSIMGRIPIRFTYNNNYYKEKYQGIPEHGYTYFINKLMEGAEIRTGIDFFCHQNELMKLASKVIYTGPIDKFYNYKFGHLDYRSVRFEMKIIPECDNYQGNAVINYTDAETPYTRIIEHKHFTDIQCRGTVLTIEYPVDSIVTGSPSYPIHTEANIQIYNRYKSLAKKEENTIFGGRLAEYKYYSMNDIIEQFI